jgi:hypothetical protein
MNITWLKTVSAVVALNAAIAVPILAQHAGSQHQHQAQSGHGDMAMLAQHLGATPEQMKQIQAIRHQFFVAMMSQDAKTDMAAKHKELAGKAILALKDVLTNDQVKMLEGHGGVGMLLDAHMGDPTEMLAALGLNPAQSNKAKQVVADTMKAMETIHRDDSLPSDQKKAKMQQLHNAAMKRFESILTADQMRRLRSMHEAKSGKVIDPKR